MDTKRVEFPDEIVIDEDIFDRFFMIDIGLSEKSYPSPHCGSPKGTHGGSRTRDECATTPSIEMLNAEYADLNTRLWDSNTPPDELDVIKARMAEIDDILRKTKESDFLNLPKFKEQVISRAIQEVIDSLANLLGIEKK